MGIGDDLMACGEAKVAYEQTGARVLLLSFRGRTKKTPVTDMCPYITTKPSERHQVCPHRPGSRPYINYKKSTKQRWVWRKYKPKRAELHLHKTPIVTGKILIEPYLKPGAPKLKQWHGWKKLLGCGLEFVQIGAPGTRPLPGVEYIETNDFGEACRVIAGCQAAILPEGGLHHACAAFNIPAVVLYGAYITPHQTGYKGQIQLWNYLPEFQGWRIPVADMHKAWEGITAELVYNEAKGLLDEMSQGRLPAGKREALNRNA